MDTKLIEQIPARVRVINGALLRDYTTFQLGGPCPAVMECPDAESLIETANLLYKEQVEFLVIGQGSNLLVSDQGLDQVILRYCAEEDPDVQVDGLTVRVSGNTLVDHLAKLTIEQGVGDLAFCSGIPGTVGGAIVGNAGAFGKQIGDDLISVRVLSADGTVRDLLHADLAFEYRSSILKQTGDVVLSAEFKLKASDKAAMEAEREEIMALRRSKHPDWRADPCAGSVFRNIEPTSAADRRQAAGYFLEEAGAKNFEVGGAHLFAKHANIIIADAGVATAQDVYVLTEQMIAAVEKQFGFTLSREIKLLGSFEEE